MTIDQLERKADDEHCVVVFDAPSSYKVDLPSEKQRSPFDTEQDSSESSSSAANSPPTHAKTCRHEAFTFTHTRSGNTTAQTSWDGSESLTRLVEGKQPSEESAYHCAALTTCAPIVDEAVSEDEAFEDETHVSESEGQHSESTFQKTDSTSEVQVKRHGTKFTKAQFGRSARMYDMMSSQLPLGLRHELNKLAHHTDLYSSRKILRIPEPVPSERASKDVSLRPTQHRNDLERVSRFVESHLSSMYGTKWRARLLRDLMFGPRQGPYLKTIPGVGVVAAYAQSLTFAYMTDEVKQVEFGDRKRAFQNTLSHLRAFKISPPKKCPVRREMPPPGLIGNQYSGLDSSDVSRVSSPAPAKHYPSPTMPTRHDLDHSRKVWHNQRKILGQNPISLSAITDRSEPSSASNTFHNSAAYNIPRFDAVRLRPRPERSTPIWDVVAQKDRMNQQISPEELIAALCRVEKAQAGAEGMDSDALTTVQDEPLQDEPAEAQPSTPQLSKREARQLARQLPAEVLAARTESSSPSRKELRQLRKKAVPSVSGTTAIESATQFTFGKFHKDTLLPAAGPEPKKRTMPMKGAFGK